MAVKVRKRKDSWWVYIDHNNKRKAKCIGPSKRAADQVAEKIRAKLALGEFEITDERKRYPFHEYFQNWLGTYVKAHCKAATYRSYESGFRNYLLPALRRRDIDKIQRDQIKQLVYGLPAQGKSRSTIKGVLAPLSEMYNHAIDDGHVTTNPTRRVLRASRQDTGNRTEKADFLTREELGLLLRTCQESYPEAYPWLSLLARTGLRYGESRVLRWEDIDFHGQFIEVRHSQDDTTGELTTPKSGKGRRVDMSTQLAQTLRSLHTQRRKEALQQCSGEIPEWVFVSSRGGPLHASNFRNRVWYRLLDKTGFRRIRIHDIRHTYASLLIQNGESLAYIRDQLGHHSIQITVDIYGHLVPGGNRAAVDKLNGLEDATFRNLPATYRGTANSIVSISG